MSKEQELKLIDSLLQDNDKKIRHNTNSLATNHSLIFDLNKKKETNEETKQLLLKEKETILHYWQGFIKKLVPYLIIPTVALVGATACIGVSINAMAALLIFSGLSSLGGVIKFRVKNQKFLKTKKKSMETINEQLASLDADTKSLDIVITGIKENNHKLRQNYTNLNQTKKELVQQRQRLLHPDHNRGELDINKKPIVKS